MLNDAPSFAFGVVSQSRLNQCAGAVHFTPGVKFDIEGDGLGQKYVSPDEAVTHRGCDIVIVGRGITKAKDPAQEAEKYRKAAWEALTKRVS